MEIADNTYTCALCKKTYKKGLSEKEELAEKNKVWGNIPIDECTLVCDDCWQKVKPPWAD